jgi:hypothetical protein
MQRGWRPTGAVKDAFGAASGRSAILDSPYDGSGHATGYDGGVNSVNGLPPQPWPALTDGERQRALADLKHYLEGGFALGSAFGKPEFVTQRQVYPQAPDAAGGPCTSVVLELDYRIRLPAVVMRAALEALPVHLRLAVDRAYVRRLKYVGAGEALGVSYRTIGRRCEEALVVLCQQLYRRRWDRDALPASAPEVLHGAPATTAVA